MNKLLLDPTLLLRVRPGPLQVWEGPAASRGTSLSSLSMELAHVCRMPALVAGVPGISMVL